MMSTAAKVASRKEQYPDKYCPIRKCLWSTDGSCCPRHKHLQPQVDALKGNQEAA